MARLQKLYPTAQAAVPPPTTQNHEGFPAYSPTPREAVAELLFLGTLGTTFYAQAQEWADVTMQTLKEAVAADPEWVARAAVAAREEGYVRAAPLVALAVLLAGPPRAQAYGRRIFDRIVRHGDDLRQFVGLNQARTIRAGFGGLARREVARWLATRLDEYQAIKYAGTGDRLSLRNILRLAHPTPPTRERNAIFHWLVTGEVADPTLTPQIAALAALGRGTMDPATAIVTGRLPFEAVMPRLTKADRPTWAALLPHAPYLFLLRSLAAMARAGVWEDPALVQQAADLLTDPARVQRARVWPHQYWQALQALQTCEGTATLQGALHAAMDLSLWQVPTVPPRTALALDVSGSMGSTRVTRDASAAVIGGLFTAALWKRQPAAILLPFGTDVMAVPWLAPQDSLATIATHLSRIPGGGTDLSAPVRRLMDRRQPVDVFIGLTDSEDWAAGGGWRGQGFLAAWAAYRAQVAPEARAILIQLVPARTRVAPEGAGIHYVYGWSDAVLRYVGDILSGKTFADRVAAVTL